MGRSRPVTCSASPRAQSRRQTSNSMLTRHASSSCHERQHITTCFCQYVSRGSSVFVGRPSSIGHCSQPTHEHRGEVLTCHLFVYHLSMVTSCCFTFCGCLTNQPHGYALIAFVLLCQAKRQGCQCTSWSGTTWKSKHFDISRRDTPLPNGPMGSAYLGRWQASLPRRLRHRRASVRCLRHGSAQMSRRQCHHQLRHLELRKRIGPSSRSERPTRGLWPHRLRSRFRRWI